MTQANFVPGTRITARGEDFIILRVKENNAAKIIKAEGISELVKGKLFQFDTAIDTEIKVLDPNHTILEADKDSGYRKTKLYLETQLRSSTSYSKKISIAHKAAFNISHYQFDPILKAFKLPRPRILIADGVGLGKTIEVGIFLAEMMKRGKGKRIMVLALKSILGQFQQEIWNRFSIPLVRLDSRGIAQIKEQLPANKNPFEFYDKTIVSIDTLKQREGKFRLYMERSRWDIIVIDECHTVANSKSMRGDLAQFLATKCESLVLTSATPHNGKRSSFANLINMIEPTAIPKNGNFTKEDVEPYYVRRFKNDILNEEVRSNFQEREIEPIYAELLLEEENLLEVLQKIKFSALSDLDGHTEKDIFGKGRVKSKKDFLFSIGLFKSYMSSPNAALASVNRRIEKVKGLEKDSQNAEDNIELLTELKNSLETIVAERRDAKYQAFKQKLNAMKWKGKKKDQRIVIFAERIDTIKYLKENLIRDFEMKEETVAEFHGGFSDIEQQAIIEDFGKQDSSVRVFLTSDAGSQGVNLHYFCNVMFNYDIPWSLITLEQRNGRIDRYGQKNTPYIYYLVGRSEVKGLKTDLHILENLMKKEDEVHKSLGDVRSVLKMFDSKKEEDATIMGIAQQDEHFLEKEVEEKKEEDSDFDTDLLFGGDSDVTESYIVDEPIDTELSVYRNDAVYYKELIEQLKSDNELKPSEAEFIDDTYLEVKSSKEMRRIFYYLPKEAMPKDGDVFRLSLDKERVQASIEEARKRKGEWSKFHMLYDLHPVMKYFMTKLEASVDKGVALVAKHKTLPPETAWFILHGQVANNIGQAVISEFFAVTVKMDGSLFSQPRTLKEFVAQFAIDKEMFTQNIDQAALDQLKKVLPDAIEFGQELYMRGIQDDKAIEMEQKRAEYQTKLHNWENSARDQLSIDFQEVNRTGFIKKKIEDREHEIKTIVSESSQYFHDLTSLDQDPYIRVISVFYNSKTL